MSALYDMRADAGDAADACRAAMAAIEAADDSSAADYKAQLKQALALFRAVPEAERRYVRNYSALASAIALVGGGGAGYGCPLRHFHLRDAGAEPDELLCRGDL